MSRTDGASWSHFLSSLLTDTILASLTDTILTSLTDTILASLTDTILASLTDTILVLLTDTTILALLTDNSGLKSRYLSYLSMILAFTCLPETSPCFVYQNGCYGNTGCGVFKRGVRN